MKLAHVIIPLVVLGAITGSAIGVTEAPFSHENLNYVLRTVIDSAGRVNYERLQNRPRQLQQYIDSLAHYSPSSHPNRFVGWEDKLAYWLNAYNAFVLWSVVNAYPVDSVRDIGVSNSFFEDCYFNAGGDHLTLNDIQNRIIRPKFRDPRIHFALNCGTVGCPRLANDAFVGHSLEQELQAAMVRFCLDPRNVLLDREQNRLFLSELFNWYKIDFVAGTPADKKKYSGLVNYLWPVLSATDRTYLRLHPDVDIVFTKYNWNLNRQ